MLQFLKLQPNILIVVVLYLAGCDSFPLSIENQTRIPMTVKYATRGGECDLADSEKLVLAPSERLGMRCSPDDLIGVNFSGPDGRMCTLSKTDLTRLIHEEKGFSGSFLLPLRACH